MNKRRRKQCNAPLCRGRIPSLGEHLREKERCLWFTWKKEHWAWRAINSWNMRVFTCTHLQCSRCLCPSLCPVARSTQRQLSSYTSIRGLFERDLRLSSSTYMKEKSVIDHKHGNTCVYRHKTGLLEASPLSRVSVLVRDREENTLSFTSGHPASNMQSRTIKYSAKISQKRPVQREREGERDSVELAKWYPLCQEPFVQGVSHCKSF